MADNELLSFISGGNTGVTYPELARRRAIAAALAAKQRAFPKTMGEGMTYLGESLGEVWKDRQTNEMEARLRAQEAATKKGGPGSTYTPGGGLFDPKPTAGAPALAGTPTAFFEDPNAASQEVASANPTQGASMAPRGFQSPDEGQVLSDAPDIGGPGDQLALSKVMPAERPVALPTSLSPRVPEQAPAALAEPDVENEPTPTSIRPAPVQVAQVGPAGLPSSMFNLPPPAFGGAPAAPARRVDAFPAEDGAAPNAPPSAMPIPAMKPQTIEPPGPEPTRPRMLGPSPQQRYWAPYIDNPNVSPEMQAHARRIYDTEDKYRTQLMQQQAEEYKDKRERHQALTDKYNDFKRGEYDRNIQQQVTLTGLESTRADLAKKYFDAGIPRQQAVTKADLDIKNAMADLQKKAWEATQQGTAQRKSEAETTTAERTAATPETKEIGGVIYQRTPASPGTPPGEWTIAPGSPKKEDKITEVQGKTIKFLQRATVANSQLGDASVMAGLKDTAAGKVPIGGNYLISPEYQRARSSAFTWAQAVLRDESGAVLGAGEIANKLSTYFPEPGDSEQVIRDKAFRRKNEEDSLYQSLGEAKTHVDKWRTEYKTRKATDPATGTSYPEGTERTNKTTGVKQRVMGGHWVSEEDLR